MRSAQKPVLGRIVSRMFSLSIYTPIQADLFGLNLQKPLQSVWAFSDWDDLGGNFSDHDLAAADNLMPETARTYMRNLRAAGKQTRAAKRDSRRGADASRRVAGCQPTLRRHPRTDRACKTTGQPSPVDEQNADITCRGSARNHQRRTARLTGFV